MVLKQILLEALPVMMFENDVEMYGAQTNEDDGLIKNMFENDVEMYGAQTVFVQI